MLTNPLNHFVEQMVEFEIYRNSQFISKTKGLKTSSQGKTFVEFFPDVDVQAGDILKLANISFYVVNTDIQTWMGEISAIKAYYQTTPPIEQSSNSTVFNISNASNSIIGNQQQATLNNSSFNIEDLKQLIELYGNNDKQQLYELSSELEQLLKKDDFHKSKLSKFSDLIAKHSWIALSIAQIIAGYLQSH